MESIYCVSTSSRLLTFGKEYEIIKKLPSFNAFVVRRDDGIIDRMSVEHFGNLKKLNEVKEAKMLMASKISLSMDLLSEED